MLRAVPAEDRSPGPGEVAVEVRAAAVNPKDIKLFQALSESGNDEAIRIRDKRAT